MNNLNDISHTPITDSHVFYTYPERRPVVPAEVMETMERGRTRFKAKIERLSELLANTTEDLTRLVDLLENEIEDIDHPNAYAYIGSAKRSIKEARRALRKQPSNREKT